MPTTTSPATNIVLADDHPLIHAGIEWAIQSTDDLRLVGSCFKFSEVIPTVEQMNPQLVIVDLRLPDGDGLDLVRRLADRSTPVDSLVFSALEEDLYAERVLRAGAKGYLEKTADLNRLLTAVRTVMSGKIYLSDAMHQRLASFLTGNRTNSDPLTTLSDRELQVFQLIGQGKSTRQIAGHLCRSVKTIETYRDRLRKKLGLNTGIELTHVAIERASRRK